MLDESLCPTVLEVQWSPDCAKACELVPSFWSDGMMGWLVGEISSKKNIDCEASGACSYICQAYE
jgi:hypothetical protein